MLPFAVCESRHTEQAPLTLDALSLRSLGALVVLTKLILGIILWFAPHVVQGGTSFALYSW
jgi:hypothetical protein